MGNSIVQTLRAVSVSLKKFRIDHATLWLFTNFAHETIRAGVRSFEFSKTSTNVEIEMMYIDMTMRSFTTI